MEVMQFKRNYEIMCKAYKGDCAMCPLANYCNMLDEDLYISKVTPEVIRIVNNVADGLIISRQDLALQACPGLDVDEEELCRIKPCLINDWGQMKCGDYGSCRDCKIAYWGQLMIKGEDGKYHEKI